MIVGYALLSIQIEFNNDTNHVKTLFYICCRYYMYCSSSAVS